MDRGEIHSLMISSLKRGRGIVEVCRFFSEDRQMIRDIEEEAEKRSLMGLGKVVNSGILDVLQCDLVYVALNNMDFDWGCHSTLVLKKGQEVVGQEVRDEEMIARLSGQKNVWFMHRNFVVYKDKICFPQDIMKKICHFEIPSLPAEWCVPEDERLQCYSIIYANPSTPSDIFLKNQYFRGLDERGLGTILVGAR